ncbi:Thiol-disulfide oxidoreductase ResA [Caulifigura coniformis]|uniref:Thiol-disulfide oxidoreductase ResA n=1 Tax=Caulifigura coniformis TaxID=2527983 RepID=A0A517SB39_9PLAN|nr:redoxin domain-containing protein [Caulifigura coniformis]QDT53329.1 Thiol-disulfide oxidoreductase ResA [Caulifigura coniformis]
MATRFWRTAFTLLFSAACTFPLAAQQDLELPKLEKAPSPDEGPRLDIGSPAPALAISDWVKGEKVDGFKPGQVYVVEFWATWCGPCLATMPHLAELQTKYGDKAQMIGVSTEETSKVADFLKDEQKEGVTWDATITYRLAMDVDGKTNEAYMSAAGERGIPTAFIVGREGVVEWIGHPARMDEPLAKVVDGTWDRTVARKEREEARQQMLAMMKAQREIRQALASDNIDAAIKAVDDLMASQPKALQVGLVKLQLLGNRENMDEANQYADMLATKTFRDSPQLLNDLSWGIAAEQTYPGTLDTALKAAKRAVELTMEKDGAVMDTLARVYFEQGNLDEAIAWSKKAVAAAEHPEIVEALKRYEAAKAEMK